MVVSPSLGLAVSPPCCSRFFLTTHDLRLTTRGLRQRRETATHAALAGGDETVGLGRERGNRFGRGCERSAPLGILDETALHRLGGRQGDYDRLIAGFDWLLAGVV